jgi:ABC-type antimicrobial peptide transport system permease subunit
MLKDSVFQGSVLINTGEFEKRFPSQQGYKVLLVDTDTAKTDFVMDTLSRNLSDFAIELTGAAQRLARFKTVEHTYLSIFQLLGGLALVLGSVGLGLVVLLNVLDRRAELAMIRAVGFSIKTTKLTIFVEHTALMLAGLVTGSVAAVIAVFPVIADSASQIPFLSLAAIISCIAASALVWIYFATSMALKGPLLDALRNE